jgi:hypothetical protein
MILSIYLILLAALGPGVYSAPNRNEYQKHKNKYILPPMSHEYEVDEPQRQSESSAKEKNSLIPGIDV